MALAADAVRGVGDELYRHWHNNGDRTAAHHEMGMRPPDCKADRLGLQYLKA